MPNGELQMPNVNLEFRLNFRAYAEISFGIRHLAFGLFAAGA